MTPPLSLPPPTPTTASFRFWWTARWWAKSDPDTPSDRLVSTFSTGIGTSQDGAMASWLGAEWIVAGKARGTPSGNQLRRAFTLGSQPTRAALYVSCMGYYHGTVNGTMSHTAALA